jgi:hypothetical protein
MSYNQTVDDLRADALFRAGEPYDSTGSLWSKALEYLNRVQQSLLLGGGIAVGRDLATSAGIYAHLVDIPITDWWWARKRGVLTTTAAVQGTVTTTQNSAAITFGSDPGAALDGYRIQIANLPTVPLIDGHAGGTSASLDSTWPEDSQAGAGYNAFKLDYALPTDFLRFASVPMMHHAYQTTITIGSLENRNTQYPLSGIGQGVPTLAFLVGQKTLQVNAWDTRGYRLEFEYVCMPPPLVAAGDVLLPAHHRAVLASGAAMMLLFDKSDPRAANFASEYREGVARMVQEHRRAMSGGSPVFGQIKPRARNPIQRASQPLGELYLV